MSHPSEPSVARVRLPIRAVWFLRPASETCFNLLGKIAIVVGFGMAASGIIQMMTIGFGWRMR